MGRRGVLFEHDGVTFTSYDELSLAFGVPVAKLKYRVDLLGWSIERAVGLNGKYDIGGKQFKSLKEICEYYDVDYSDLKKLHQKNGSYEGVVNLTNRTGKYIVDGKPFKTLKEVCEYYDVTYYDIKRLRDRGGSLDGIVEFSRDKSAHESNLNETYMVDGKPFKSLKEMSRYYNVSLYRIKLVYRETGSYDGVSRLQSRGDVKKSQLITEGFWFREKFYDDYTELANDYGIKEKSFIRRHFGLKWSLEESLLLVERPGCTYEVEGVVYESLVKLARSYGIEPTVLHNRIKVSKWSMSQALGFEESPLPNYEVVVEGVLYESISSAARAYGIDLHKVHSRMIKSNWTLEEALGIIPRKKITTTGKSIELTYEGVPFKSLKSLCTTYGINVRSVYSKIKTGVSVVDAVDIIRARDAGIINEAVIKNARWLVFGEPFRSLPEIATHFGVSLDSLNYRRKRYGMSIENAILDMKRR